MPKNIKDYTQLSATLTDTKQITYRDGIHDIFFIVIKLKVNDKTINLIK